MSWIPLVWRIAYNPYSSGHLWGFLKMMYVLKLALCILCLPSLVDHTASFLIDSDFLIMLLSVTASVPFWNEGHQLRPDYGRQVIQPFVTRVIR